MVVARCHALVTSVCGDNGRGISLLFRVLIVALIVLEHVDGLHVASAAAVSSCSPCPPGTGLVSGTTCKCKECVDGSTFSRGGYEDCTSCTNCGDFVVVLSPCNVTSDTKCSYKHCTSGRIYDENRWVCVTLPVPTSSPSASEGPSPTSSNTLGNVSSTSVPETRGKVTPSSAAVMSESWKPVNEESNSSVMVIVAVTTSSFVLFVLAVFGLVRWFRRKPQPSPTSRRTPDVIKDIYDLPDDIILRIGSELANRNNPAHYQQLLAELGADPAVGRKLDIALYRNVDDFSRALFIELEKFKSNLTVSHFCETLKGLGAVALVRDILQLVKEHGLILDEFEDLDGAIDECVGTARIIQQEDDTDSTHGPCPENPCPALAGNLLRHSSQASLISSNNGKSDA